jgi:hypothetical protein
MGLKVSEGKTKYVTVKVNKRQTTAELYTTIKNYRGANKSLARPGRKQTSATKLVRRLTCFLSASVTKKACNSAHEQTPLSNDTIDSVLRHREVGRAKDLSAPLYKFQRVNGFE